MRRNKKANSKKKLFVFAASSLFLVGMALTISLIKQPQQVKSLASTTIPQGMYDSCAPVPGATSGTSGIACNANANLDKMAAAGFKIVQNYDLLYSNISQLNAYLDHANAQGMKVMIPLNDPVWWTGNARTNFSGLAATCACSDNTTFVQYIISQVKNHPATWGYYVGDEVSTNIALAQNYWSIVRNADPVKPTFIVSAEDEATLGRNMDPLASSSGVSVLASDIYPIGRNVDSAKDPISSVGQTVSHIQSLARLNGKQTGVVLQSYNWKKMYPSETWLGAARFPTRSEMRIMRDDALANGNLQFILWYSYFDLINDLPSDAHWADLQWAAFGDNVVSPIESVNTTLSTLTPTPFSINTPLNPTPVRSSVILNLGNSNIGSSTAKNVQLQYTALKINVTKQSTATNASIYISAVPSTGAKVAAAIYADIGNKPGARLWNSAPLSISSIGWKSVGVPSIVLQPGTYWFGFNTDKSSVGFKWSLANSNILYQEWLGTFRNWPNTMSSPVSGIQPYNYSMYLTLTQ